MGSNHLVTVEAEAGRRRNNCLLTALVTVELEKPIGIQDPCLRNQGYHSAVCGTDLSRVSSGLWETITEVQDKSKPGTDLRHH